MSRCIVSLIMRTRGEYRHFSAGVKFPDRRMRARRITSSAGWRGFDSNGTTIALQPISRYHRRLGTRPVYRNRCIVRAVAPRQRVRCSFHGTAKLILHQVRRVLSSAYSAGDSQFSSPASRSTPLPSAFFKRRNATSKHPPALGDVTICPLSWGLPKRGPSMTDQCNEPLQCPRCRRAGLVSLCQPKDAETPIVHHLPDGFKAIHTEYGPNFHCGACGVPVQS